MSADATVSPDGGPAIAAGSPAPPSHQHRWWKARTDIRFATLMMAVLASSVVALTTVFLSLPATEQLNDDQVDPCLRGIAARVASLPTGYDQAITGTYLMQQCVRPFFAAQATTVGVGLAGQIGLAGLLYALHPWWLARRRRLAPLPADGNADVLADLAMLSRQAGLPHQPTWLLAPYAATHGGQAFGLPRCRRVALDVGLLVRFDIDRPGFRAVIRHELAHLRNRDVDQAYLTIAIWWSFALLALAPFLVLSLFPDLLRRPFPAALLQIGDDPGRLTHRLVTVLVLAAVVYLARNAILRARETHADVVAAESDSDGALPRVVAALPWPGTRARRGVALPAWGGRSRYGTHPSPAERARTLTDTDRLARMGGWEMAGIGLTAGLALRGVSLLGGNLLGSRFMAMTLVVLPVTTMLTAILAAAVSRDPAAPRRRMLLLPAALSAGLAASGPLSMGAIETSVTGVVGEDTGVAVFAVSTVLLLIGLTLTAAWVWSVQHGHAGRLGVRQRRAIVVSAVAVSAPLLALWYWMSFSGSIVASYRPGRPDPGWAIGWYATLADWTGLMLEFQIQAMQTPITSAGMVLLWAVPVVVLRWWRRSERLVGLRRALLAGLGAGLAVIAVGAALPFAARAALPVEILHAPANMEWDANPGFLRVYHNVYTALAVLGQAVAAGIVAAGRTRLRPVFVPVAVCTTAVLATLGLYVSRAVSSCVGLTGVQQTNLAQPCDGRLLLLDGYIGFHFHSILSWGAIAAVLAALVGAAARALLNYRAVTSPEAVQTRHPGRTTTAALGLLALLGMSAAAAEAPGHYQHWKPNPPPAVPDLAPPAADPCVIGAWREVVREEDAAPFGSLRYRFTGAGATQTYHADGTTILDYGAGVAYTATIEGRRVALTVKGQITARYQIRDGTIAYYDAVSNGTQVWSIDGADQGPGSSESSVSLSPDRYHCAGDTLVQSSATEESYRIELRRVVD
ncbi:M48 family metalloprotease [Micromonospora chokoriensis]|uniref:Peptidase family M48 n=1 Tax=Micromonospora chokoriensis TaxID=356851 RepID=A0A1C4YRJ7_9ACTN|nr:M48 family metalloprotease [Micromonospora chokoriensis]SCF23393.1 Peptidase family M48 [Micromonospora chokoriensis]